MRVWWERLKWCWFWLWQPAEFVKARDSAALLMRLAEVLRSPVAQAAKRAVQKSAIDPSWKPEDFEKKRTEAIEWTRHYLDHIPPSAWEVRFLIEWFVGEMKGRL